MPIGTARMTHLALAGSRLYEGLHFDDDPRVADIFAEVDAAPDGTAVLFPGPGARTLETWPGPPPRRLIVLDGTWHTAANLLRENPRLASLPRLAFTPSEPGRYRIRKEPRDECLSTIEAVAAVLSALEGDDDITPALMRPFDAMVERQIEWAARRHEERRAAHDVDVQRPEHVDERGRPGRHRSRRLRRGQPDRRFAELLPLLREPARVVVVYAEANAAPRDARNAGVPGLLHLVAQRPFIGGDVLDLVVRPGAPLHDGTLQRLGLSRDAVDHGVDAADAVAAFRSFVGDGRLLCWGSFARDLLAREGDARRGFVDLRAMACRALEDRAGGLDVAATRFGLDLLPPDAPRARRMLAAAIGVARVIAGRAAAENDGARPAPDDASGILTT